VLPPPIPTLFPYTTLFRSGCASTKQAQFQGAIRKAAKTPVVDAEGDVPAVFRDLAQSGGLDPHTVYVEDGRDVTLGVDDGRLGRSEEHTSELQSRGHLVCR